MASAAVVIGLTGGIASGKSAAAALLREHGAAVVDADELARRVVAPGQPALSELVARFGPGVLLADGQLDRKKLGALVFADAEARADLGRITHPRIAQASKAEIARHAAAGANIVFYEAALLVENGLHRNLDGLIVVAAPLEIQRSRLMARDQLTAEAAEARIAAQLPLAEKLEAATWVIDNRGDPAALRREVERVRHAIEARFGPLRRPDATAVDEAPPATEASPARGAPRGHGGLADHQPADRCALVTGFPSFAAKRMIHKLATSPPATDLFVLAAPSATTAAAAFVAGFGDAAVRVRVLAGDVCSMHLGLSSLEYRELTRALTHVHHLGGLVATDPTDAATRRYHVGGTETVIDLARDAGRLQRLVHWSSALISGARTGVILETELDRRQPLAAPVLRALLDGERLAAAATRHLPITVLRPSIIVGDSQTGALEPVGPLDGMHRLLEQVLDHVAAHGAEVEAPLLGHAPVHVVPIDFAIDAAHYLATLESAAGRTFHLTDPSPMLARELFEAVAALLDVPLRPRAAPGAPRLSAALRRWWRRSPLARHALRVPTLEHVVSYDQRNSLTALETSGLACPPLASYLPVLVRAARARRPRRATEPDAPLAP